MLQYFNILIIKYFTIKVYIIKRWARIIYREHYHKRKEWNFRSVRKRSRDMSLKRDEICWGDISPLNIEYFILD